MPRSWRKRGEREVVRDRWMDLRAQAWETPQGAVLDPWWMIGWPEWVHVLAITPDDRIVLVRQWRPGAGQATLELPGGIVDAEDTDPVAAAARELQEETGYSAPSFRVYAAPWSEPAHATNRIHFALADRAQRTSVQHQDPGEDIAVELHPVADVLAGLEHGMLASAAHIGGVLMGLRAAGRLRW